MAGAGRDALRKRALDQMQEYNRLITGLKSQGLTRDEASELYGLESAHARARLDLYKVHVREMGILLAKVHARLRDQRVAGLLLKQQELAAELEQLGSGAPSSMHRIKDRLDLIEKALWDKGLLDEEMPD